MSQSGGSHSRTQLGDSSAVLGLTPPPVDVFPVPPQAAALDEALPADVAAERLLASVAPVVVPEVVLVQYVSSCVCRAAEELILPADCCHHSR